MGFWGGVWGLVIVGESLTRGHLWVGGHVCGSIWW